MKKQTLLFLVTAFAIPAFSQRSRSQALEDSVFAWKGMAPLKPESYSRTFTPAQQKLPAVVFDWIKQSYLPLGAIDESFAGALPNKKDAVEPYGIGASAVMWKATWSSDGKKVVKGPASSSAIFVFTNHLPDAIPVQLLSRASSPVFTRRSADPAKTFKDWSYGDRLIKEFDLQSDPQIGKYPIQYYGCTGEMCQPLVAVFLAPGNRLPIRQLTRGEVLTRIEAAISSEIDVRKSKLKSSYGHRPESLQEEITRFETTVLPKWKGNMDKLRKESEGRLDQPAYLKYEGIGINDLENGNEVFSEDDARHGVYTYEDGVLEKSKGDQPLWVVVAWWPANQDQMPYLRENHRSMSTRFNFDYAYSYFFDPEKVKAVAYQPRNAAALAQNANKVKSDAVASKTVKAAPAGYYFFDDFSGSTVGEKPKGWTQANVGRTSVVVDRGGELWMDLGEYKIMPVAQKAPLPDNFEMEFDLAGENFAGNTGGSLLLTIHDQVLSPQGDYVNSPNPVTVELDLLAGSAKFTTNPTGYVRLKATYKGMDNALRYADVLQYSNDFSNVKNKVHLKITRKDGKVRGFVDGKEIIPLDKYGKPIPGFNELPADTKLSSFFFTNRKPAEKIYVGNVSVKAVE
ncbi:hypothetical protein J0A68_08540 [Algoriphagus sp. H41]|uniref:Uncharacterized protein n=1 Tax=Algoriphagus oliviformis TaxID=2811231 RepID=A0ABS3C4A0_9BACT|nr:hypothetical protein [Algoriphagus oliviformis]MBN7811000.1 hypothetical protein [Algoriphagus oliviformis]